MPVIAFANSVASSGTTTAALLAAIDFAHRGYRVAVLDADEDGVIGRWGLVFGQSAGLTVFSDARASNVGELLSEADEAFDIVVVDLPSEISPIVGMVISAADLVVIPVKSSAANAAANEPIFGLIETLANELGKAIPHSVLFTGTAGSAKPQSLEAATRRLKARGVHVFRQTIAKSPAFRTMFEGTGAVRIFDPMALIVLKAEREIMRAFSLELMWRLPTLRRKVQAANVTSLEPGRPVNVDVENKPVGALRLLDMARTRVAAAFAA